jgi:hypothetical protein
LHYKHKKQKLQEKNEIFRLKTFKMNNLYRWLIILGADFVDFQGKRAKSPLFRTGPAHSLLPGHAGQIAGNQRNFFSGE